MMLMSTNMRQQQQECHDATFACPCPTTSSTSSSMSTVSFPTYATLKIEHDGSSAIQQIVPPATAQLKPAALVRIASKSDQDQDYSVLELNKPETTIGREQCCDHSIVSVEISRKHAMIKYQNGRWWIIDLNSTNGLFVNGGRVKAGESHLLEDGCIIVFGPEAQCNYKYIFQERYGLVAKSLPKPIAYLPISTPQPVFVDPSGYETSSSVCTQDMNPPPSPASSPAFHHQSQSQSQKFSAMKDLFYQLDFSRNEISKLKMERAQLDSKFSDMSRAYQSAVRKSAAQDEQMKEKQRYLDSMICKYRTLCGQLEEAQQSQRSATQSDDESNYASSGSFSQSTVSSILKEMTCTICSEYMIAPTSLSCSHVFCQRCIDEWCREYRSKYNSISPGICPVCRNEVKCQTQVLVLENVINFMLDQILAAPEKEDRAKVVAERKLAQKRKPVPAIAPISSSSSSPPSLDAIIQGLLGNFPTRSTTRRRSIMISSDDDDSDHEGLDALESLIDGARRIRRISAQDVVQLDDDSNDGIEVIQPDGSLDDGISSDEEIEEEYNISISLNGADNDERPRLALALDSDSEDSNDDEVEEILLLGDDSFDDDSFLGSSGGSSLSGQSEDSILFDLDYQDDVRRALSSSPMEPIVISDSEESNQHRLALPPTSSSSPVQPRTSSALSTGHSRPRRSSMIFLSDSEDSQLFANMSSTSGERVRRRNRSHQNGSSPAEIALPFLSAEQAAPGGGIGRRDNSHTRSGRLHHQHSSRVHPYGRKSRAERQNSQQNQSLPAPAAPRRAALCA